MSHKIIDAVRNNHYSQLLLYLRHGYNFKIKSFPDGHNILMVSLQIADPRRRYKMFEFLLKQDLIDVLDSDVHGHDVFFITVMNELENELELLMRTYHMEVDWSKMDHNGKTLLHYAVINSNLHILETLLNYCSKYKINVDIPDKVNKITPYLLACRLNNNKAAELLLKIGKASKSQADQEVFYDGERWKQAGQLEKFQQYLKCKEEEMNVAKLNGNVRIYRELSNLSRTLDSEITKNPDLLPVIAKVIIDYDEKENLSPKSYQFVRKSKSAFNSNSAIYNPHICMPEIKNRSSDFVATSTRISSKNNKNDNLLSRNGNNNNSSSFNNIHNINSNSNNFSSSSRFRLNGSTTSSYSNSSTTPISSASSSIYSNYYRRNTARSPYNIKDPDQSNSPVLITDINSVLKQTMNKLLKKQANELPQFNSLLEMTNGQTVDHFVGSKSDGDSNGTEPSASVGSNSNYHSNNHSHHSSTSHSGDISAIFLAAALQKTGNYRAAAKYVEPPPPKEKPPPKPKPKTGLSSLAIIREESRVSTVSKRSKTSIKKSSSVKIDKSLVNDSKSNLKTAKISV